MGRPSYMHGQRGPSTSGRVRRWTPREYGPALWIEADISAITIATGISQINDLSGNGRHHANATGTKQPTLSASAFGTLSGVLFDGVNDFLLAAGATLAPPYTRFIVAKYASATASGTLCDLDVGGGGNQGRIYRATSTAIHLNAGAEPAVATTTPQSAHTYAFIVAGASSLFRVDGTQIGTFTAPAVNPGSPILGTFGDTSSDPANVLVGADVVFPRIMTTIQMLRVEAYLRRWGTP